MTDDATLFAWLLENARTAPQHVSAYPDGWYWTMIGVTVGPGMSLRDAIEFHYERAQQK
jgi:hypothetical protein